MKNKHKIAVKKHVDKKLIFRLKLFFIIFIAISIFVFYDIFLLPSSIIFVIGGYLIGALIGFVVSRMFNIFWHETKEKVVSELDAVGVIILICYIGIAIGRNYVAGYFFTGLLLTTISFSIIAGIMLGRLIGTGLKIKKILHGERKLI